jgi:glycosyltransferase involved in cell wall biosynthesis
LRICFLGWGHHVHFERWAGHFFRDFEVHVISVSDLGHYPPGVRQHRLGLSGRGPFWKKLRLRWLLRRICPDIVHVHYASFATLLHGVWSGPTVVTAWGSDIYRLGELPRQQTEEILTALGRADCVTCDSSDLREAIIGRCTGLRDRIHEVQWGVDTDHFVRRGDDSALRREFGVGQGPVVLSPRNFTPLYNLDTIVEAFARVVRAVPEATLILKNYGGDEGYKARVMGLVEQLRLDDHVRLIETIDYARMPELYSLATVAVSIPSSDATPMSLLEAMACGVAPVCSDLPSLREWIEDGTNGCLVPCKDAVAVAEGIEKLLTNPDEARRMALFNRSLVEQRASQAVHMDRMRQLYKGLRRAP